MADRLPVPYQPVRADRYTALTAAGGAIFGARNYPFWTAVIASVGLEAAAQWAARTYPSAVGNSQPGTLGKSTLDIAAAMASWWLARKAMGLNGAGAASKPSP